VLAQLAVGAKTNEIPVLRTLLGVLDIIDAVITPDALHCQRDTAKAIIDAGGHYILTVKTNQPTLRTTLTGLPWKQMPVADRFTEHGNGRTTTRVLNATGIAVGIGFPYAMQVQLTRTVTDHKDQTQTQPDRLRDQLAHGHRRHPRTVSPLVARPLGYRKPAALGPRRQRYAEDPYSASVFAPGGLYRCIKRSAYKTSSLTNPILGCQ